MYVKVNKIAHISSIIGYCRLIFVWQFLHFPFKNMYDKTGIFSYQLIFFWHLGHFEGGQKIDSPLSPLKITTFAKLPMQSPIIPIKKAKYQYAKFDNSLICNCYILI